MTGSTPLFRTPTLDCRLISPDDSRSLDEAAGLDLELWGGGLGKDADNFASRASHGYLIGAWHWSGLVGTISCLRRTWAPLDTLASGPDPSHPYATWDAITSDGTFLSAEPEGDVLFCVAVTTMDSGARPWPRLHHARNPPLDMAHVLARRLDTGDSRLKAATDALAEACAPVYIPSDYVMRFHRRPKGSILSGARIVAILQKGRPSDLDSMGYNVIMVYPNTAPLAGFPESVAEDVSAGDALVLSAARLAYTLGVGKVAPFSRPAGFRRALVKTLLAIGSGKASAHDPLVPVVQDHLDRSAEGLRIR